MSALPERLAKAREARLILQLIFQRPEHRVLRSWLQHSQGAEPCRACRIAILTPRTRDGDCAPKWHRGHRGHPWALNVPPPRELTSPGLREHGCPLCPPV